MLSLAQLNSDKFRKQVGRFDIREAVREVMTIQQSKADFFNIQLTAEFLGFGNDYNVCTDE